MSAGELLTTRPSEGSPDDGGDVQQGEAPNDPISLAGPPPWHILQMSDVLDLEFAAGLAEGGPVTLWQPERFPPAPQRNFILAGHGKTAAQLRIRRFPVLRGAARLPGRLRERLQVALLRRLLAQAPHPAQAVLVCTTPFFAALAERWPGPVVYWLTDLIAAYRGVRPEQLHRLDERLCRRADLVCPNSARIGDYLRERAGCPAEKIKVLPNATRAENLLAAPLQAPCPGPAGLGSDGLPVAGVIGALGGNMDWMFLQEVQRLAPWLRWAFVGPTDLPVEEPEQKRARKKVLARPGTLVTGPQPYGELFRYARAFSVGVLPYRKREPTFSGSSTRFYEHLAATHPMLATHGVAELLSKEPLLRLAATPEGAAQILESWRATGFDDGLRTARWRASLSETWTARGQTMRAALAARLTLPRSGRDAPGVPPTVAVGPHASYSA